MEGVGMDASLGVDVETRPAEVSVLGRKDSVGEWTMLIETLGAGV